MLQWDDEKGPTNISLSPNCRYDLSESGFPHFQKHNLGMEFSIVAGIITQKDISELLKFG